MHTPYFLARRLKMSTSDEVRCPSTERYEPPVSPGPLVLAETPEYGPTSPPYQPSSPTYSPDGPPVSPVGRNDLPALELPPSIIGNSYIRQVWPQPPMAHIESPDEPIGPQRQWGWGVSVNMAPEERQRVGRGRPRIQLTGDVGRPRGRKNGQRFTVRKSGSMQRRAWGNVGRPEGAATKCYMHTEYRRRGMLRVTCGAWQGACVQPGLNFYPERDIIDLTHL